MNARHDALLALTASVPWPLPLQEVSPGVPNDVPGNTPPASPPPAPPDQPPPGQEPLAPSAG